MGADGPNQFKFNDVNRLVATSLGLQFQGGIRSSEVLRFLESVNHFQLFTRGDGHGIHHLIDGVMSGCIGDCDVRCFSYGYIMPMDSSGFSISNRGNDYFCVVLSKENIPDFDLVSLKKSFLERYWVRLFGKKETTIRQDTVADYLGKTDPDVSAVATKNELLVFKNEPLSEEEKKTLIRNGSTLLSILTK